MKESTQDVNHSAAPSVTTNAQHQVPWRLIKESILVRNHSAAHSVISNAQHQAIWSYMKEYTLVINHSAAPSVTTSAQTEDIWRLMQESTQLINHWAVPSVTKNAPDQVFKNMKEVTLVRNNLSVTSNALTQVHWSNMKEDIQVWKIFSCAHCDSKCSR